MVYKADQLIKEMIIVGIIYIIVLSIFLILRFKIEKRYIKFNPYFSTFGIAATTILTLVFESFYLYMLLGGK